MWRSRRRNWWEPAFFKYSRGAENLKCHRVRLRLHSSQKSILKRSLNSANPKETSYFYIFVFPFAVVDKCRLNINYEYLQTCFETYKNVKTKIQTVALLAGAGYKPIAWNRLKIGPAPNTAVSFGTVHCTRTFTPSCHLGLA